MISPLSGSGFCQSDSDFFCRFRFGGVSAGYFGKGRCDRVVIVAMPFIVFVCVARGIICQFAILVRNSIARFCVLSLPEQSLLCGRLNENISSRIPFLCFVIVRASRFAGSLLKPLFVWKIFLVTVCYMKVRLWVRLSQNVSCRIPFLCIGILRTPSLRRSVQREHCNSFDLFGACQ